MSETEFVKAKSRLRNLVWHGALDTGARFDECLDAVEACDTPEELERTEKAIRLIDATECDSTEPQARSES